MMNLYQLRYFFDSARLRSITEAARIHAVTQSAVSQAIKSLEASLESKLIHHKRNRFELTEAGQAVFGQCQTIFGAVDNLKTQVKRTSDRVSGTLTIATTNSLALTAASKPLVFMAKAYPDLAIRLFLGDSNQVKEYLRSREAELGLLVDDEDTDGFESTRLQSGSFVLVAPSKTNFEVSPLKVMIAREHKDEVRYLKRKLGNRFSFRVEAFSWELLRQMCLGGAGIAYLPDYVVREDISSRRLKVIELPIKTWPYRLISLHQKGRVLTQGAEIFLSKLDLKK
ncbi:MAG: LysR family transcriptional regulator [Bdellovibrionales bacterium]|nr:LysR family transcriptional regulator [Bdellovibrionales bacterium]